MLEVLVSVTGSVIIAVVLVITLMMTWENAACDTRVKRVLRTIGSILWAGLYIAIEAVLTLLAVEGNVTGAYSVFALTAGCVCFGGVSTLLAFNRWSFEFPLASAGASSRWNMMHQALSVVIAWILPLLAIAGVSLLCFVFLEMLSNPSFLEISEAYMTTEMAVIVGVVAGSWLICQRRPVGFILPMAASLIYGIAEYFVESFKTAAIKPSDLRSFSTGLDVAGGYEYTLTTDLLLLIGLFAFAAGALAWLRDPLARFLSITASKSSSERENGEGYPTNESKRKSCYVLKHAATAVASLAVGFVLVMIPISNAMDTDWKEAGLEYGGWDTHIVVDEYGLIPSFMAALQLEVIEVPDGYEHGQAEELQKGLAALYDQYVGASPERQAAEAQFEEIHPNVVLIMNESFSDISSMDGLGVGYAGLDYMNDMEAIAKGLTSVSIHGGGTCNSEFESLAGISLGYPGVTFYPYALCDLSQLETFPKQFKSLGYDTTGIHPAYGTNWSRDKVYPVIGFDEFMDSSYFDGADAVRGLTRDAETYDKVIERIMDSDAPQFIFDLTIMGHGGYATGLLPEEEDIGYDFAGIMDDELGAMTNEYVSVMRLCDEEIEEFIIKMQEVDEPTVVAFFGDHQPHLSSDVQAAVTGKVGMNGDIESQEELFQTDYFIWANYDIAGSAWSQNGEVVENGSVLYTGSMAPADLMDWTMNFIGAPMTDFGKASYMSRLWVQSNNIFGFMDSMGTWHVMNEAEEIAGPSTFTDGMQIIGESVENGLPPAEFAPEDEARQYHDAVMVNVMKWITYLNFAEKV